MDHCAANHVVGCHVVRQRAGYVHGSWIGIDAATEGDSRLSSNLYIWVWGTNACTVVQCLKVHSSCSQPLYTGDQFGSILLTDFVASH